MNAKRAALIKKLRNKKYRDAFVASQITVGIPFQVRAVRSRQGLDQKTLAKMTGMAQPRISAIETPGAANLNLKTLRRIASAFDVALIVRFAPFSELIRFADDFSPDQFQVLGFAADIAAMGEASTSKVVSIFTGRPIEGVLGNAAKPPRRIATTKPDWVQGTRQREAQTTQIAETNMDYREVSHV